MTTVEKLVVQIFDRKKWIIEQAKRQAETYNHHLASKLLIDGITPPSWLFTPTTTSSDSKELNKEDVITKILYPYQRPSVCRSSAHYPLYSSHVGTGDINEGPNGENRQPAKGISCENELDVSITSPMDQTDERISCIYNATDQSLARIQRSKSRQKALELRSGGGKSLIMNGVGHENINDNFRLSIFSVEQDGGGKDEVVEGCKDRVFNDDSCRKDVLLSHGSVGIKRRGSDFDSSRSDCANKLRKSGPSAVCFQSSVLEEEEGRGRDAEDNVTRLDFSCKPAGASSESEFSDNAQRNHNEIMDNLPADYALGPLVRATGANVFDKGCSSRPEDCQNEKGKETSVDPYYRMAGSSSSSPQNACADKTLHQAISSHFNEDDSRPFPLSSGGLARQIDDPSEEPGLGCSFGIIDEKRDTDMAVGSEHVLRDQLDHSVGSSSVDTNRRIESGLVECSFGIINEKRDFDVGVGSELVLRDQLHHSVSSSSVDTNRRIELESVFAPSPTTSLVSAEPNELNIDMHKAYNLKILTPISRSKRLNNASEMTGCSFSDIAASVDNVILCKADRLSIAEVSKQSSDVHKKGGDGICDYSEVQDGKNIMHLEVEDTPELRSGPVKLHLDHRHDSLPVQHVEMGSLNASYSLDVIKKADLHDDLVMKGEAGNPACDIHDRTKQIHTEDCQALPCQGVSGQHTELTHEDSGFTNTTADGSPAFTSWPRLKKRKIDHQQETYRHTTSPCIRTKFLSTKRCPSSTDLMNLKNDVDLADAFRVTESTEMEMNQLNDSNLVEVECSFESQNGENQFYSMEQNDQQSSSTVNEQSKIILVASPTKKRARNSDEQCVEGMGTHSSLDHLDAIDDKQCSHHLISLDNITNEKLTFGRVVQGTITCELEDGQESQCLVGSPRDSHQEFDAVDQSMPVYEGFMVDAQANSVDLECLQDEIDLDQLKLPSSMIERADVLAKICRSASTKTTPLSDSSSASQSNLFKSVPNGLFKSLNASSLPVNGNVHESLSFGNGSGNNVTDSFERMPYYSDSLAYSGVRFGWNSRYPRASPVGKFLERLSSHSSSSGKCLTVHPDLTCFRIEEDFCVGDENETMAGDKRQPLKETTNLVLIPPDTKYTDKEGLETQTSSLANTGVTDNQSFSFSAVRIKKSKESINNSVSKTVLRSKSSLNRPEQKLSLKESGRNNIVSHFSSFLPLVQSKKGAAPAGKREVKVKALETAEAAKRLEEERENKRKKKKEAVKAERAKLEEKNLRQMELEKKKKEEERKKKDANILARKRIVEEEERKEREKKRVRLEARQRQREQEEEKVRAKKYEKENDHPKREKMNSKKELKESKKPQNKEMVRRDDAALKNTEVKRSLATSEIYTENCGISGQSLEAEKGTHTVDKSPTSEMLIVQNSQEKSYEISPYQCSDGEDEEDDELHNQKYVPSWASKSSVALVLPLQQGMDPDAIFLPKSCCSVDEEIGGASIYFIDKYDSGVWTILPFEKLAFRLSCVR